jgi:hypothetical protein
MSPDAELQLRETRLTQRLRRAANRCATPDSARRLIAFALRCVQEIPLPDGTVLVPWLAEHPSLLEAVKAVERWLGGRPLWGRHPSLHGDLMRAARAAPPDSVLRAACAAVHEIYLATREAVALGDNPDWLRGPASRVVTIAHYVMRPSLRKGPTPRALEYQERLFAEMFSGEGLG